LPGGLYSTPEQDKLAHKAGNAQARSSLEKGVSFTPPMAPSVPVLPAPPQVEKAAPGTARPRPVFAGRPSKPVPIPVAFPAALTPDPPAAAHPEPQAQPIRVAEAGDPKAEEAYSKQIGDLFSQWGGRTPRTDIVLPQLHTAVEVALPEELSILSNPNLLRRPVGQETVNGITTTKYAVEENLPGGHIAGALWLSPDGIPMRCDGRFEPKKGKTSTIHWELRNVKFGRQDEALFTVPQGYAKLSPEAAAPLLGMHLARPSAH